MPLIVSGVPAGKVIYAIINDEAGSVYLPGSASFGPFTSQPAAAIALAESPAGSGRHTAAFPAAPSGRYGVTYFERAGDAPDAADEAFTDEPVTVQGGNLNVVLEPTYTTPPDPVFTGGPIQVYAGESGVIGIPVFDSTGATVILDPSPVFTVYRDTFPNPTVIFIVTASVSGNTATVAYTSLNTATPDRLRYEMKAVNGDVLAQGRFDILPTV